MKKIITAVAAMAMAASVFAADVAATVKLSSDLFKFDGASKGVTLLGKLNNAETADYATIAAMSVGSDKAGAGIKFWGSSEPSDKLTYGAVNVWIKPIDVLKLSFRENGDGLFGDKYHGYEANKLAGIPAGYGVEFASNGLSVKLNLAENYLTVAGESVTVADTGLRVAYSADFGSVAAIFDADKTFKDFTFGAGYSGNIGPVGAVLTAAFNTGAKKLLVVPSAGTSFDALSLAVEAPVTIVTSDSKENAYGLFASVAYNISGIGLKACFEDANLAGDFDATVKLETTCNVGSCGLKVTPGYNFGSKVFNIGFEAGISF